jgi:hypothetical protein
MPRHLKYLNDVTTYSPRDIIYTVTYNNKKNLNNEMTYLHFTLIYQDTNS